jgi:NAD(P)-dependent dehydrogenase (short-subunit alcohol dehydrogenase family)
MAFSVSGKTVLITGAARGMGRMYANLAADGGAGTIVLWDVSETGLDQAATALRERGASVVSLVVDGADHRAFTEAAAEVLDRCGPPHILINNAGVVRDGYYWDNDPVADVKFVMDVNAMAPMYITSELLRFCFNEGQQILTANFFFSFEQHPEGDLPVTGAAVPRADPSGEALGLGDRGPDIVDRRAEGSPHHDPFEAV